MWKILPILAVVFAIAQAPIPATGKAADKSTSNSHKQTEPANDSKHPPANIAAATREPEGSRENQSKTQKPADYDSQTTITVSEPAPVPVTWHWYEALAWIANLVVAGVAVWGIGMATKTLKKLERQTVATEIAAKAANTQAEAAMGVAIPTLVMIDFRVVPRASGDVRATIQYPRVEILLKNFGQSPAIMKCGCVMVTCDELPNIPYYASRDTVAGAVIDPGQKYTVPDPTTLNRWMENSEIEDVMAGRKTLTIYGYFLYGNIFNSSERPLKFCKRMKGYGSEFAWNPTWEDEALLRSYVDP
jgi:hypothetical protein